MSNEAKGLRALAQLAESEPIEEYRLIVRFPTVHSLKTWPLYFAAIVSGEKTFEVRKADRDFQVGDTLLLREFRLLDDTGKGEYTGRKVYKQVSYVLTGGQFGIEEGYCVLGIQSVLSR